MCVHWIALFTVTFAHLHGNVFERGHEAISGKNFRIARNCLTSTFKHIVMQMRKGNCEKGYYKTFTIVGIYHKKQVKQKKIKVLTTFKQLIIKWKAKPAYTCSSSSKLLPLREQVCHHDPWIPQQLGRAVKGISESYVHEPLSVCHLQTTHPYPR